MSVNYKLPILLIELEQNKSFSLEVRLALRRFTHALADGANDPGHDRVEALRSQV